MARFRSQNDDQQIIRMDKSPVIRDKNFWYCRKEEGEQEERRLASGFSDAEIVQANGDTNLFK